MSTTSTVVAFRAGLLEALADHATIAGDGVQVADGWQGPDTQDEGIYLTGLTLISAPLAFKSGGRMPRNEEYEQTVVIQAWRAAETPQENANAVARVFALFAALEDVTATDVEIGGVNFGRITAAVYEPVTFETGWMARMTVTITCMAALT